MIGKKLGKNGEIQKMFASRGIKSAYRPPHVPRQNYAHACGGPSDMGALCKCKVCTVLNVSLLTEIVLLYWFLLCCILLVFSFSFLLFFALLLVPPWKGGALGCSFFSLYSWSGPDLRVEHGRCGVTLCSFLNSNICRRAGYRYRHK